MKTICKILISVIIVAVGIVVALQGVTKIYHTASAAPFNGEIFYNPYQGIDSAAWKTAFRKANFHAHTRWDVNGNYTVEEFERAYQYSGYEIIGVSDHNMLTRDLQDRIGFTPSYEHGWNANNFHILMLGADRADVFDNPFMFLPRHQMQYAMERLSSRAVAISINHPERIRAIPDEVFSELRGFSLMEINPDAQTRFWDKSLSVGNYVTLVGSDDAHSITNRGSWFQRSYTMVCPEMVAAMIDSHGIIDALKAGRAYGVTVSTERNNEGSHRDMPTMENFAVVGDTLSVAFSVGAVKIAFIGDAGQILKEISNVRQTTYTIPKSATYVRVVADMPGGVTIYSNPVVRSADGMKPTPLPLPQYVEWLTILNSIGWGILTVLLWMLLIPIWRRKAKKRMNFEDIMWGAGQKTYDPT